jgi:hypothetical protein
MCISVWCYPILHAKLTENLVEEDGDEVEITGHTSTTTVQNSLLKKSLLHVHPER